MKIYTKTGDGGETALHGGRRVSKAAARVEAYGEVDELNAHLGWAAALLGSSPLAAEVQAIQAELFTLGAGLATPTDAAEAAAGRVPVMDAGWVERLEQRIDRFDAEVPPLRNFILPGGGPAAAALQVCRAVCRRAERSVVRLAAAEPVDPRAVVYLNRLSDLLFVLARWVNHQAGIEEPVWKPPPA
jgi:cob(I)alamin adenosyltransferase